MYLGLFYLPTHLAHRSKIARHKDHHLRSSYISTDDALSAFIWKSIIRVRLTHLHTFHG